MVARILSPIERETYLKLLGWTTDSTQRWQNPNFGDPNFDGLTFNLNEAYRREQLSGANYNEARSRRQANKLLSTINKTYYYEIPVDEINHLLTGLGFSELEFGIYFSPAPGDEGNIHERVGPKTWFTMTWYRMPSWKYEIVAYLS